MKLLLSTIIGGAVIFILTWLLYLVIFVGTFQDGYEFVRRATPAVWMPWSFIIACLLQSFFMSLIYPLGYKGSSPVKEGFMFGLYLGLLLGIPYILFLYSFFNISFWYGFLDGILRLVIVLITGLVIGLVYGKKEESATA